MTTTDTKRPLFYRELTVFDSAVHGKLRCPHTPPDYRFAAETNLVPLLVNEAVHAARHYPLVFIRGEGEGAAPALAAVVGVGDGVNRFIEADGSWRAETYIPAWVRRYPFFAVRTGESAESVLALDLQAEGLESADGEPLVGEDGNPTEYLQRVLAFNREFQAIAERTQAVTAALDAAGVLEPGTLRFVPPGADEDEAVTADGFLIVNEKRLRELDDEPVLALQRADALGLAYAQLLSIGSLGNLMISTKSGSMHPSRQNRNPGRKTAH